MDKWLKQSKELEQFIAEIGLDKEQEDKFQRLYSGLNCYFKYQNLLKKDILYYGQFDKEEKEYFIEEIKMAKDRIIADIEDFNKGEN